MYTATRTTVRNASTFIAERKPFTAGGNAYGSSNFRGERGDVFFGYGRLDDVNRKGLDYDRTHGTVSFIVWSYGTPIAWYSAERGWYRVEQRFSVSTSRHQATVRSALS